MLRGVVKSGFIVKSQCFYNSPGEFMDVYSLTDFIQDVLVSLPCVKSLNTMIGIFSREMMELQGYFAIQLIQDGVMANVLRN